MSALVSRLGRFYLAWQPHASLWGVHGALWGVHWNVVRVAIVGWRDYARRVKKPVVRRELRVDGAKLLNNVLFVGVEGACSLGQGDREIV